MPTITKITNNNANCNTLNDDLILKLCKKFKMKIIDADNNPIRARKVEPNRRIKNRAFVHGNSGILLGHFDNQEMKFITFLHELGHIFDNNTYLNKYEQEKYAWEWAMNYLKKHYPQIKLSQNTLEWCDKQLETYSKHLLCHKDKPDCFFCTGKHMYSHRKKHKTKLPKKWIEN